MFTIFQGSGAPDVQTFLNVFTSLPLSVAGAIGIRKAVERRDEALSATGLPFLTFCFSLILSGVGSIWYHSFPSPANLLWDRLPIALSLASLACGIANLYPGSLWGTKLLGPAVVTTVSTVVYWNVTRLRGHEDLVPYAVAQVAAAMFVCYVSFLQWPHKATSGILRFALLAYAAGRVLEGMQAVIYSKIGFDFAHPGKHLLMSAACFLMISALSESLPAPEADMGTLEAE